MIDCCRVCGSKFLREFLNLGDQPHGDSFLDELELLFVEPHYPLRANFCVDCTTVQIDYTVPKEVMFEHYLYLSGTTKTLSDHFRGSANRLVGEYGFTRNDLVVDIGSNDGTWLQYFKALGLQVLGIDGARNVAEIANRRGLETWPEFFNKSCADRILETKGSARFITAAGVFFHLEELHSVTEGVRSLLAEDGVFCIQAIYLGEMIEGNKFDQIYHEHLTYWTLYSLRRLLDMHHLEVVKVRHLPIHGGSLELHVCHRGRRAIHDSVLALHTAEERKGYQDYSTYADFSERVWRIKGELIQLLESYRESGLTVYALGAPIKGATLLNSFGIGTELVSVAVEINDLKIGKYIPGARIPIVAEADAKPPSAYLLLAWNFLPELIAKFERYLSDGGEFIVPFPYPRIIRKENINEYLGDGANS